MEAGVLSKSYNGIWNGFDPKRPEDYNLCVQVEANGVCVLVAEHRKEQTAALQYFETEEGQTLHQKLEELFAQNELLQLQGWNEIVVGWNNHPVVWVPQSYFDEKEVGEWWRFNNPDQQTDDFYTEKLEVMGAVAIAPRDSILENKISTQFPGAVFKISKLKMVQSAVRNSKFNRAPRFYMHIGSTTLDLIVVHKGKLVLDNRFNFTQTDDALYHLANTKTQIFPDENIEVLLSGFVDVTDPLFTKMKDYFDSVRINFGMDVYKYAEGLVHIPKQAFVSAQNLQS